MPNNSDSTSSKLVEFLMRKLLGSTLEVVLISSREIKINAGEDISLSVIIETNRKRITFSLFSPVLDRQIIFQEVTGVPILDMRLKDELKSSNHEAEEQDIMLAIDLLKEWSKENKFGVSQAP